MLGTWLSSLKTFPTAASLTGARPGVYILPPNLIDFYNNFTLELKKCRFLGGGSIITKHFYCRFASQCFKFLRNFRQTVHKCRIFLKPFQLLSNCLLVSRTFIGECGRIFTPGQDQDSEQAGVQGHHVSVYSGTSELDKIPACLQTNALSCILI